MSILPYNNLVCRLLKKKKVSGKITQKLKCFWKSDIEFPKILYFTSFFLCVNFSRLKPDKTENLTYPDFALCGCMRNL